jgi:hypothetical protein
MNKVVKCKWCGGVCYLHSWRRRKVLFLYGWRILSISRWMCKCGKVTRDPELVKLMVGGNSKISREFADYLIERKEEENLRWVKLERKYGRGVPLKTLYDAIQKRKGEILELKIIRRQQDGEQQNIMGLGVVSEKL